MKRALFLLPLIAAALLGGCGDPAPSTPVAPDKALPDTSKMSPEEVQKLHQEGSAGGSDRGATPADRQMPGG